MSAASAAAAVHVVPMDDDTRDLIAEARWRSGSTHDAPGGPFADLTGEELLEALADAIEELAASNTAATANLARVHKMAAEDDAGSWDSHQELVRRLTAA